MKIVGSPVRTSLNGLENYRRNRNDESMRNVGMARVVRWRDAGCAWSNNGSYFTRLHAGFVHLPTSAHVSISYKSLRHLLGRQEITNVGELLALNHSTFNNTEGVTNG